MHLCLYDIWRHYNGCEPPKWAKTILIAGCGSFAPYPFSIANPGYRITALDLSSANLRRAKLHCLLHLRFNLSFIQGDILSPEIVPGPFGFIDSYGVLHHLHDPLAGLMALKERTADKGIIRVMLYSHGARRKTESARRALRRIGILDTASLKRLIKQLPSKSKLRLRIEEAPDADFESGLADAFLHPQVRLFRVNELSSLIAESGLELLEFRHCGALADTREEWLRLHALEKNGGLDFNYIMMLRKKI